MVCLRYLKIRGKLKNYALVHKKCIKNIAPEQKLEVKRWENGLSGGTHLRRDTVIPPWFQASKAAAASDRHAVHC